jgi:hypothetical protein
MIERCGKKLTPKQAAKKEILTVIHSAFYLDWEEQFSEATEREIALIKEQAEKLLNRMSDLCRD